MDNEIIMQIAQTLTSQKVLIGLLYAVSSGWFISFIFSKTKYNKLLDRCEGLQESNVRYAKQIDNICSENEKLREENELLKKELENHD